MIGARRVMEDDIHDGYYIPKGSMIIPNVWLAHRVFRHIDRIY
jgi:cytochrome P450